MDIYKENAFVFSSRYRFWRHLVFWLVHVVIFTWIYKTPDQNIALQLLVSAVVVPAFIIYAYPIMYWFVPQYLLKEKNLQFITIMILWGVVGWFWNHIARAYILFPFADLVHFKVGTRNSWAPAGYLIMNLMAGYASMIILFKYWTRKQRDFLSSEKEKVNVELQLLKAQVHPHFLFNTLNNIYSFSMENSPKTPHLVLKLSSLLSYILYDCKSDEVLLEKEIEIMKNYIDLEKERYGNKLEISLNIEGDIKDKYIVPLLLLPFLENAFKHGTSEQLDKPWLSMDLSVKQNTMRCKIVNSKNEMSVINGNGIGIKNVQKRLAYLYPAKHELKLSDEESFFVVSLLLELSNDTYRKPIMQVSAPLTKNAAV
jgi:two-component system, LytTR family, sensor histidine kinase AlgZ